MGRHSPHGLNVGDCNRQGNGLRWTPPSSDRFCLPVVPVGDLSRSAFSHLGCDGLVTQSMAAARIQGQEAPEANMNLMSADDQHADACCIAPCAV